MVIERPDALVVGGGPAGALAATLLARRGWGTVLIERGPQHRSKTCGHCLNRAAIRLLEAFHLRSIASEARTHSTACMRLHRIHRDPICIALTRGNPDEGGGVLDRSVLDQRLRDAACAAGAEIIQPARASMSIGDAHQPRLSVQCDGDIRMFEPRLLIAADGLGSAIARACGMAAGHRSAAKYGLAFDVDLRAGPSNPPNWPEHVINMFLLPNGYIGAVRCGARLHVAAALNQASGRNASPRDALHQAAAIYPQLDPILSPGMLQEAAPPRGVAPMPWRCDPVAAGRVVLAGDAAGYVEPFTGQGIAWALHSAALIDELAAQTSPKQWRDDHARAYARAWRRAIQRSQRACHVLTAALRRPMLTGVLASAASSLPMMSSLVARKVMAS